MQKIGKRQLINKRAAEKGDKEERLKLSGAFHCQLATIAGQHPNVRRARKSIAAFKLREGMPVGLTVTLRRERAYEFLDRLITVTGVDGLLHAAMGVVVQELHAERIQGRTRGGDVQVGQGEPLPEQVRSRLERAFQHETRPGLWRFAGPQLHQRVALGQQALEICLSISAPQLMLE